jgi:glycosyltransferase involved in cell wall biosynthesis
LPIIEAMAAGCPILTANRHGTLELARDAAILVDPESVDSIAEGIGNLLDDATLRNSLRMLGRARAASMTWEATARNTLDVLEAL